MSHPLVKGDGIKVGPEIDGVGGGGLPPLPGWVVPSDVSWPDAPHPADEAAPPPVDPSLPTRDASPDGPSRGHGGDPWARAVAALGVADRAMAGAIAAVRQVRLPAGGRRARGGSGGMATSTLLSLTSGRTSREMRLICRAEKTLAAMPEVDAAFAAGMLTWSQVNHIIPCEHGGPTHTDNLAMPKLSGLGYAAKLTGRTVEAS